VIEQAKVDAAVLKVGAPVEDAFAIWQRSCSGLRLLAELDPDRSRAQQLLDDVVKSEARMNEMIARGKGDAAS
jgi:hypothetical protein